MKCKVFTGRRWDAVERQAYGWLATQKPTLDLHHLETRMRGPATVTLWYDVTRGRPVSTAQGPAARSRFRVHA